MNVSSLISLGDNSDGSALCLSNFNAVPTRTLGFAVWLLQGHAVRAEPEIYNLLRLVSLRTVAPKSSCRPTSKESSV